VRDGLLTDRPGDYMWKKIPEATGQEILTELVGQPGFGPNFDELRRTTTVIPVMMPYIASQYRPHRPGTGRSRCRRVPRTSRSSASSPPAHARAVPNAPSYVRAAHCDSLAFLTCWPVRDS